MLPSSIGEDIVFPGDNGSPTMTIHIDSAGKEKPKARLAQGMAVYENTADVTDTVVRAEKRDDSAGVEAFYVLKNRNAPEQFTSKFRIEGATLEQKDPQTILALNPHGVVIGAVSASWARDTAGKQVPISLSVRDGKIITHVKHRSQKYQYPIVADPSYVRNCGRITCSFYFTRRATKNLKDTAAAAGGGAAAILAGAAMCGAIPVPGSALCAAAVLANYLPAMYNLTAAVNRKGCFVVRTPPTRFDNVASTNRYCRY
ncbi:hypothetical protein [Pyxidicoccus xibeiensis]|uniref:hypothetical protein n=1 Tax=Pyxidicoccus xibeiensis TaxID=2906759 RepID=UPI0020A79CE0|nr:hypothetical protein [Pyxidicoccus xibeiensis]MCP3140328.1 hypothetical protein [Pyxidicoccus xibeiensis]